MIRMTKLHSSYKDPSGHVFKKGNEYYRQVNMVYRENYDELMRSGLYKKLTEKKYLIKHSEEKSKRDDRFYKIIKPERINFISYPYEWCFSAYKEAAMVTLSIQKIAMDYGMSLKDASSYNIAFHKGSATLIDTLSFEKTDFTKPWIAYRQFCMHFLAPLVLMAKKDVRLGILMRFYINGIPLDLVDNLLPLAAKLDLSLAAHIKSHTFSNTTGVDSMVRKFHFNKNSFRAIVDNLYSVISSLKSKSKQSEWSGYYEETNYTESGTNHKHDLVFEWIKKIKPKSVWDFGSNSGAYSSDVSFKNIDIVQFDNDPQTVERAYQNYKKKNLMNTQSLFMDMFNPSPGLGWMGVERDSLIERGPADLVIALALMHHLLVGNNLGFEHIVEFFSKTGKNLLIEFIPTDDSNFQIIAASRMEMFLHCTQKNFETEFAKQFQLLKRTKIRDSKRWLYLYRNNKSYTK